jgi:hypothetical protein
MVTRATDAIDIENGEEQPLSVKARGNFFLSVNYLTLLDRFLNECCLRVSGSVRSPGKCLSVTPPQERETSNA